LNALRAFEAAARHTSFTLAAAELNVTHAAVSPHVRDLETDLGVKLFARTGRGVTLTDEGRDLSRALSPAFDALAAATEPYLGTVRRKRLVVTAEVTFAAAWLVPRLGRFAAAYPDCEIVVDADNRLFDLLHGEADVAIRYGRGTWPGLTAHLLSRSQTTPVASAAYLKRTRIRDVADLARATLLREDARDGWSEWLELAGYKGAVPAPGPMLKGHLALQAAEAGQGLVLAEAIGAADAIAGGRLVRPFPIYMTGLGHYLITAPGSTSSRTARAFRTWIDAELTAWRREIDWPE